MFVIIMVYMQQWYRGTVKIAIQHEAKLVVVVVVEAGGGRMVVVGVAWRWQWRRV